MISQQHLFNLAHIEYTCHSLGPGYRTVIWLQGCKKNCPGCINKKLQSFEEKCLISPKDLLGKIKKNKNSTKAITITGGEPFLQAESLAIFVRMLKEANLPILIYTGFSLNELLSANSKDINLILENIDVLIDGDYQEKLKMGSYYIGSSNQNIYFITDFYNEEDFAFNNSYEFSIVNNKVKVIGFYNG